MILSALARYYDRTAGTEDGPPPQGFQEVPVVGALVIGDDGALLEVRDIRLTPPDDGKKKPKPQARRMAVPQLPKRTVAIQPGFLCDNAGYLLGFDTKGKPDRALYQFAQTAAFHHEILDGVDDPVARALLAFFDGWNPEQAAAFLENRPEEMATGWLVFWHAPSQQYAHNVPALRLAWERRTAESDAPHGQCLVTGETDQPIALIHPSVKGVWGAQSSGASLVSFNQASFTSYGKEQNLNAPIGARAAFAYTTALNHLMRPGSPQRLQLGDATVIIWTEDETPLEKRLAPMLGAPTQDEELKQQVQDTLHRVARGRWQDDPEFQGVGRVRTFVLGLAPNAARLQLRYWLVDTLGVLLDRMKEHIRDILLVAPEEAKYIPTFRHILRETVPKDAKGDARTDGSATKGLYKLQGDFMRAVLAGHDYPQSLLPLMLDRLRSDGHYTTTRLGLIKGALNRHARMHGLQTPEIKMALDQDNTEIGYLLGRLFALLERMQEVSRGTGKGGEGRRQPTIRDRFAAAASVTPKAVFPHLLGLKDAHEKKARRDAGGIAFNLSREIGELMARLDPGIAFPTQMDQRQQGLFFIGYYQQRQSFFGKHGAPDDIPETDDTHIDSED